MEYENIRKAYFLNRLNRFSARVFLDGRIETVHVKNTGRLKELLKSGRAVILEEAAGGKRKTKYSLVAVFHQGAWVNIDSLAPNKAAAEALADGKILEIGTVRMVKREFPYGNSRFDLYYEKGSGSAVAKGIIEVKGVTLVEGGAAIFPDAPTVRGKKHMEELCNAVENGFEAAALFLIQRRDADLFQLNWKTDPAFSEAVQKAQTLGVKILAYDSLVTEKGMVCRQKVPLQWITKRLKTGEDRHR